MRFIGTDADIRIDAVKHPEFDAWQWVEIEDLVALIVPFKRNVYEQVVEEFRQIIVSVREANNSV